MDGTVMTEVYAGFYELIGGRQYDLEDVLHRIDELEGKVSKHNNLIERTYKLEGRVLEAEHDIRDLKNRRDAQ